MRNWILSALVLIVAIGCATAHSINSKSRYVSTEYGFSAEIPEGWIRYDDLNDAKRQAIGSLIKPEGRLVLADSSSNRIIVASGYRNSDCWSSLKLDLFDGVPVCFKDQITKSITKTIEEEINPAHYSLDVSPSGFQRTNRNWRQNKAEFEPVFIAGFTHPIRHSSMVTGAHTQIASYPCHGGRVCALWVTLLFKENEFSENTKTLRMFKSSIRAHDKEFP